MQGTQHADRERREISHAIPLARGLQEGSPESWDVSFTARVES